ncbi:MAG TPA: RNA chaperone Hfq [Paenisporosarcina sp.]|jgi:host factor-I protein|nr:RNA chaperone Hfq [Paenisporosarcina sp.]
MKTINMQINIQDVFLNQLRKNNVFVTVFLLNGFQLKGHIKSYDNFTVLLESEGKQQLIYKHAISTFVPAKPVSLATEEA